VRAQGVDEVVLDAAGEVEVPEGAAGEGFDGAVVGGGFEAEEEGHGRRSPWGRGGDMRGYDIVGVGNNRRGVSLD